MAMYPDKPRIAVGMATCGVSSGAAKVHAAMAEEIEKEGLDVELSRTGCIGYCSREPLVDVLLPTGPRVIYERVTPEQAGELVRRAAAGDLSAEGALCRVRVDKALVGDLEQTFALGENGLGDVPFLDEVPFFSKQVRVSLRNSGFVDPDSLEQYIGRGGYQALHQALTEMDPASVIQEVKSSGLRGRGGAGFSTGKKWEFCQRAPGDEKYVICNADEGDPGAFMDRNILEGDPFSVIEGMTIGAFAMGASRGYVYCRAEYPLALRRMRECIAQATDAGLLGDDLFGSGFSFNLSVRAGAGAFVCGEETALIASIEGEVGEPRTRPPFPAERGLWGKPTNINNVKTWSHIAPIIARGADWYSSLGVPESRGTTVFSLVGKVRNTGLVEIPLGMSIRELLFDIGGGTVGEGRFKAVQTGGPSGGCIPARFLDTSVTYEDLGALGSIMGSGGLIVMDESTCMVDLARYFISFTQDESCGKCTPCREGTRRMNDILAAICEGSASAGDLELLEELAEYVKDTSLCGLGSTAPNPVLTTLQYFREEYEAHVHHRQCPARACTALSPAPCQGACPAGIDVPSYVALIAAGEYQQALDLIREDNPLPAVCGYVCTHPCEGMCKRRDVDQAVAIKHLKRAVADWEMEQGAPPPKPTARKGEPVAVIGAGPAGLTAAHFLAQAGHPVTVFDSGEEPGGMLMAGIPGFRLPRDVIRYEIDRIGKLGVQFRTGVRVGTDLSLEQIREEGFGAVYVSIGAYREMKLAIPGEAELSGITGSLEFLEGFNRGEREPLGGQVLVVGGGNAAIDCARAALRLGPEQVTVVYRRSRGEMPADPAEIREAEREGVQIRELTAPVRVEGRDGHVTGMQCIETRLGEPDESGRRRPVPVEGSELTVPADRIITAIGQQPDPTALEGLEGVTLARGNRITIDPATQRTALEWLFAGGDAVTGPATVIEAVGAGKLAARAIHRYLAGEDVREHAPVPIPRRSVEAVEDMDEDEIAALARVEMPTAPVDQRLAEGVLVETGLDVERARREAHRCLRCDINR